MKTEGLCVKGAGTVCGSRGPGRSCARGCAASLVLWAGTLREEVQEVPRNRVMSREGSSAREWEELRGTLGNGVGNRVREQGRDREEL